MNLMLRTSSLVQVSPNVMRHPPHRAD